MSGHFDVGWLYSDETRPGDLKRAVRWFAGRSDAVFERGSGKEAIRVPFAELFRFDLENYCVLLADADGRITEREVEQINWLLDDGLSVEMAYRIEKQSFDNDWPYRFPASFRELVELFGKANDKDFEDPDWGVHAAMVVARLLFHLAQFIYCIDNEGPFDETVPVFGYVASFALYVRRVKVSDFKVPEGEKTIEQTLKAFEQVQLEEISSAKRFFCGVWKSVSGTALSRRGLSDLVLKPDGTRRVLYGGIFGQKEEWLDWSIDTSLDYCWARVLIPSKELEAILVLSRHHGKDRIMAVVDAPESLKGKMVYYVRSKSGEPCI